MKIINDAQEIAIVPVGDLQPHPDNPRRANQDAIRESIAENGFYGAVVAQRSTRRVLAGHGRLAAAVDEGAAEVPVIWLDVDNDRARRILLADNRTNDLAAYDDAQLAALLQGIQADTSLAGTGYDAEALEALIASVQPDYKPTDETPPRLDERTPVVCPECGHAWHP